jgi:hypothetical protein
VKILGDLFMYDVMVVNEEEINKLNNENSSMKVTIE